LWAVCWGVPAIQDSVERGYFLPRCSQVKCQCPCADGAEPVGGQGAWGDDVHDDGLALGGAAPGGLVMVDAPPTAVGVRPVDRRGSLVARPHAPSMSLKRTVERGAAAVQARQHFTPDAAVWGPPLLPPSAICGAMAPLHLAPVAPCRRGGRRCLTGFGKVQRGFFDPDRIVAFLLSHAEFSSQFTFASFPSPHFPHATAALPQHGIVLFHAPPA